MKNNMEEKKPKILNTRIAFESRKFRVFEQDLEFPDGHRETWEFIEPKWKAGVQIMALTRERELVLVREYRGAAEKFVLRMPTGSMEEGERPEESALRELAEEAGFQARKITLIEERHSTSSYFKSALYVFLAEDLDEVECKREKGEQSMEILKVPMDQWMPMIEDLQIDNPNTVYSIIWLKKYLQTHKNL